MRIIAGDFKGLKLKSPEGDTRPTSEKAREAIFSSLQLEIPGAAVLDLFAGSGAMGIEAASRGAEKVVFNDNSKEAARIVAENCVRARLDAEIHNMDYNRLLKKLSAEGEKFDIIFIDPPYASGYGRRAIEYILENDMLNPGGVIVHERSAKDASDYPGGVSVKTRRYGIAAVDFLRKIAQDNIG